MPKWLHDQLSRRARKLGLTEKRRAAYVYGTLSKYKRRKAAKRKRSKSRGKRRRR